MFCVLKYVTSIA